MAGLHGKVIATLESRRADEIASLIRRNGGTPYSAPALREVPLENREEVAQFIRRVIEAPPFMTIFLTGVGARALLEAAGGMGSLEALRGALEQTKVVARGPKPVKVLRDHQIRVDLTPPEPNTSQDIVEMIRPLGLRGKVVALQHYGEPNVFLRGALQELGAELLEVSLYAWAPPEDPEPLVRFLSDVQQGGIDVVAATSQSQIRNLFALAGHFGQADALRNALNQKVAVAAVGPVCAEGWRQAGVEVDITPEHPHMGHLIQAIGRHLEAVPQKG